MPPTKSRSSASDTDEPHARRNTYINGIGATATGVTLLIVLIAKVTAGAWITLLIVPVLLVMFAGVKRHYEHISKKPFAILVWSWRIYTRH